MTLLIACMIIAGFELPAILYIVSIIVWVLRLVWYGDGDLK